MMYPGTGPAYSKLVATYNDELGDIIVIFLTIHVFGLTHSRIIQSKGLSSEDFCLRDGCMITEYLG